jgi:hypothetical protein
MKHVRVLGLALATLALAACGTTQPKTFTGQFEPPPANSRVLLMTPDIQLALLTAAGLQEPREDWSRAGRDNLAAALAAHIQSEGHATSALDPATAMEGRIGQIIRLHDAVGTSILAVNYLNANVPTRRNNFEWTLGEGVRELATAHNADYALFVTGRGSYASAGRVAAMVGLAVLGVGVPLGGQQAFASLVDLRTGNVIWFNVVSAAPGEDMREADGASELAARLMRDAPL